MFTAARFWFNFGLILALLLSLLGATFAPKQVHADSAGRYWPRNPTENVVAIYNRPSLSVLGISAEIDTAVPQIKDSIYGFSTNRVAVQATDNSTYNIISN